MAANTIVMKRPPLDSSKWFLSYSSTDVSAGAELKAAVTGKTYYLTKIHIQCASAITVSIGGGVSGGALVATFIGPIPFAATTGDYTEEFPDEAMVIGTSTALAIDASGGGNVYVWAEGKLGPVFP